MNFFEYPDSSVACHSILFPSSPYYLMHPQLHLQLLNILRKRHPASIAPHNKTIPLRILVESFVCQAALTNNTLEGKAKNENATRPKRTRDKMTYSCSIIFAPKEQEVYINKNNLVKNRQKIYIHLADNQDDRTF